MAQTKRKRRSKHRGTPAGTIEARGRTGRRPTAEEAKQQSKQAARRSRMMQAPTWKGALIRAGMATLLLLVFTQTLGDLPLGQAVTISIFAFALYVPLGYYTDRFIWKRRMAREARQKSDGAT